MDELPECKRCGGKGYVWASDHPGGKRYQIMCHDCAGTGIG